MFSVNIITIFPEVFPGLLDISLLKKARNNKIWKLSITDLKNFSRNGKKVDDTPFGGGPGMIIRPDVLQKAYDNVVINDERVLSNKFSKIILSPRGKRLDQSLVSVWSKLDGMVLVCGRYEGIDERFIEENNFEQISLGDFILMGGEIASMAIVEAVIRLQPNVLGNPESLKEESFNNDVLEYPQYTRPREWRRKNVPKILLSGNHKEIEKWRKEKSQVFSKKKQ